MKTAVTYEKRGPVAHVLFDDGKVNVMSAAALKALHAAFDRAQQDRAIVVLRGRPGIFSAGFDLKVFASGSAEEIYEMMRLGAELAARVLAFPTPVVAACTGHAYPMGAFLLLASDVRIGVEGPYRIGFNEVAINIAVPSFGLEVARQRLQPAWFQRAALTGEMFAPADAMTAGFLDRVASPDAFEATLDAAVRAIGAIDLPSHATTKMRVRKQAIAAVRAAIESEITIEAYRSGARRVVLPGARSAA